MLNNYLIYNNKNFVRKYNQNLADISNLAFYDRREVINLFPPLENKNVLDAGFGTGVFLEYFITQKAFVTGIDFSKEMHLVTKNKLKKDVKLYEADLNEPFVFLSDNQFDLIICTMVLMHIPNWDNILKEFYRVLKPNGQIIISLPHPLTDLEEGNNYFETKMVIEEWEDYEIQLQSYRKPLSSIFEEFKKHNFIINDLKEPKPLVNDEFSNIPWFIIFKLIKFS